MKTTRFIPHLSFFGIFLVFGFWAGQTIGNSAKQTQQPLEMNQTQIDIGGYQTQEATPTAVARLKELPPIPEIRPTENLPMTTAQEVQRLPGIQRNLLVIGVDDLSLEHPNLVSTWLIIYRPETPHFMFMPIYPTPQGDKTDPVSGAVQLPDLFKIDEEKVLRPEFLNALEEKDIWWTGYIILDKVALSDVAEFIGGAGEKSGSDGATTVMNIPPADQEPQKSLLEQAKLIQGLCLSVTNLTLDDHWRLPMLFDLVPNHALTNLDLDEIAIEWKNQLRQIRTVKCEFPSLVGTGFHP